MRGWADLRRLVVAGAGALLMGGTVGGLVAACGLVSVTASDTMSGTLATAGRNAIVVEMFNGAIEVKAGPDGIVSETVTRTGQGSDRATALVDLQRIDVSLGAEGDRIVLRARYTPDPTDAVQVRSSNGDVGVSGGGGLIDVQTSNGSVDVSAIAAVVQAKTSNGAITFVGSLARGISTLQTSNGLVQVALPADASFGIDATTSSGRVTSDFPVTATEPRTDTVLRGRVGGAAGASLTVANSNGDVRLLVGQ